jgi:hypothetical protein
MGFEIALPGGLRLRFHGGDVYLSGSFPEHVSVTDEMVEDADPEVMWADGSRLFFRLANAEGVYEDTGQRLGSEAFKLYRLLRLEI